MHIHVYNYLSLCVAVLACIQAAGGIIETVKRRPEARDFWRAGYALYIGGWLTIGLWSLISSLHPPNRISVVVSRGLLSALVVNAIVLNKSRLFSAPVICCLLALLGVSCLCACVPSPLVAVIIWLVLSIPFGWFGYNVVAAMERRRRRLDAAAVPPTGPPDASAIR